MSERQAAGTPRESETPAPRTTSNQAVTRPRRIQLSWTVFVASGILAVLLGVLAALSSRGGEVPREITTEVTRGNLLITIIEGGELESSKTVDVHCEIEVYQPKIIDLLPEGSGVEKGQVVVRLDASDIQRAAIEQEIKAKQAQARVMAATEEYEIQKNKAASAIAAAELALKLATLDRVKYMEGQYKVEVDDLKGLIALAETELQDSSAMVEHYRKLVKKGFRTPEQLRAKEQTVERYKYNLTRDKEKLRVLEEFTRERNEVELTAKAQEAVREVERVRRSAAAEIAKVKTDLEAAEVTARLEEGQLTKLKKQVEACTVAAPQTGILIYSHDKNNRVQLGATAHFRQKLFSLPDLRELKVKAYVHESAVNRVKAGLSAEIRIDAHASAVLHGKVASVATFFDSTRYWMQGVKEYVTMLDIDDLPDVGLKPGMTAEVKILVSELRDVLMVPLQAVVQIEGEHFVYVLGAAIERRGVVPGETNGKLIEIKEGLAEGERLLLNARSRSVRGTTGEEARNPR